MPVFIIRWGNRLMSQIFSHIVWKDQEISLNNLCASNFEKKIASQHHIPPKLSSLSHAITAVKLHCQRAHFQTALCQACLRPNGPKFKYVGDVNGLELQLVLNPLKQQIATYMPDKVLIFFSVHHFSHVKFNLTCSEFCKCIGQAICKWIYRARYLWNLIKPTTQSSDGSGNEESV